MVPEDLLFWLAPIRDAPTEDPSVLCRRHADAMVVPRGWTLDDRREATPRLFKPRPASNGAKAAPARRGRRAPAEVTAGARPEQLQIDGTGEIPRPNAPVAASIDELHEPDLSPAATNEPTDPNGPWQPDFDVDDDLGGLLDVESPLLARAFRGTGRPRS